MYSDEVKALVETKAYEIWENNGRLHGYDLADWLRAEALVLGTSDNSDDLRSEIVSAHEAGKDPEEKLRIAEAAE